MAKRKLKKKKTLIITKYKLLIVNNYQNLNSDIDINYANKYMFFKLEQLYL